MGQPRVVLAITGGGGSIFSDLFGTAGASSCILEAVIPYSKNSCLDFLKRQKRDATGIGFCSEDMAWRLCLSSRDRALTLENDLNRWPDVHGVAATATIVSHYQRRGGYRVHAAAVNAQGMGCVYTHEMVKGARNRHGEDMSCALLACRALAESCNIVHVNGDGDNGDGDEYEYDIAAGVRLSEEMERTELGGLSVNEVGEEASGVETIPSCLRVAESITANAVVVVSGHSESNNVKSDEGEESEESQEVILAPKGALPEDAVLVSCVDLASAEHAIQTAQRALEVLGLQGDGELGSWGVLPAPVLLVMGQTNSSDPSHLSHLSDLLNTAKLVQRLAKDTLENVGVLVIPNSTDNASSPPSSSSASASSLPSSRMNAAAEAYPEATHVIEYSKEVVGDDQLLDDGSPSTVGVNGVYIGNVSSAHSSSSIAAVPLPHGEGSMTWENGISYQGHWNQGMFHGHGAKIYSRGGGYVGQWKFGQRHGTGISLFDGKHGFEQWEGSFEDDKPNGCGLMRRVNQSPIEYEFIDGKHQGDHNSTFQAPPPPPSSPPPLPTSL